MATRRYRSSGCCTGIRGYLGVGRQGVDIIGNGGDDSLLRCARDIDLNPVRARMTDDPREFPWSSCASLCGLRDDALLTPHPVQRALGAEGYATLAEAISDDDLAAIRLYLRQQRAYGRDDFRAMVEAKTQRFASVRPAHRPANHRLRDK